MRSTNLSPLRLSQFDAEELEGRFELKPWVGGECPEDCVCEPDGAPEGESAPNLGS